MRKTIIKIIALSMVFMFCGLIGVNNTWAAGRKFAVSPMNQRVLLMPGETYQGAINVAVPSDATEPFEYLVSIAPYSLSNNETTDENLGGSDFETVNDYNQIVDWITIANPEGTIQPNEQRTVAFTITVPEDVPAGGQYAALLIRENDGAKQEDDSMAIKEIMQMAHIIYAEVAGETRREGEILENNIPSILLSNTLKASSAIKNTGNAHTDAEYILQVWPLFSDEELYTNEEDPKKILILPNETKFHNQEVNLPAIGIFRVKQTIRVFGEESMVEKMVIVCPVWLLFVIIFAIIMLIMWIIVKIKQKSK